jgi:uncharacterized protein (DUF111 family)
MEYSAEGFGGVNVEFSKVSKHGIMSTFCHVEMLNSKHSIEFKDFISKIEELELDDAVKDTSINIFRRIAEACATLLPRIRSQTICTLRGAMRIYLALAFASIICRPPLT